MKSNWKQKKLNQKLYEHLLPNVKNPILCAIASVRDYGIKNFNDFNSFISNNINNLQNPDILPNIKEASDLLRSPPKSAFLFGDYDVDGTFSAFMLKNILYGCGCKDVKFYIPHRKIDGYGLNENSLSHLLEQTKNQKVELVVFLDCGTNSRKEITTLKEKLNNPKVLVIDHHIIDKDKYSDNADVVINNHMAEDAPPYSTGGLVYQISRQLKDYIKFSPDRLLPYAAIATIADVSPLYGDNRLIVANGLKQLGKIKNYGMLELFRVSGIDLNECSVEDISFKLAPRINANGRIEHAEKVLKLLNESNEDRAFGLALEMNGLNEERKKIQKSMTENAIKKIGEEFNKQSILLYNEEWEIGIVGIVASKLTEKYGVPSIIFGNHDGQIKGSARSVKGINIKEAMDKISHIFHSYGGHEMAAGAVLKKEFAKEAHNIFEKAILEYKKEMNIEKEDLEYDLQLKKDTFLKVDNKFCDTIQKFGPFGHQNEKILFRVNGVKCQSVNEWSSGSGAFVSLEGLNFDCFFYGADAAKKIKNKTLDILFEIGENFREEQKWAIIIKDYSIPTKYYAGVGSRDTPQDILDLIEKISAFLREQGYTLRSGGADGADSAFEKGAGEQKEIFLPWPKFNNNKSTYDGDNWKYKKIHLKLAKEFHPSFEQLTVQIKKLMVRNSAQIIGKDTEDIPSDFVICYTKDGKDSGGTGQALRIARSMNIPIYNLHDENIRKNIFEILKIR